MCYDEPEVAVLRRSHEFQIQNTDILSTFNINCT